MADSNLEKFKRLLAGLFMFDCADLDVGIYRIMNARRAEITRFLNNDLLPQVRAGLATVETAEQAQAKAELDEAIDRAKKLA